MAESPLQKAMRLCREAEEEESERLKEEEEMQRWSMGEAEEVEENGEVVEENTRAILHDDVFEEEVMLAAAGISLVINLLSAVYRVIQKE